MSYEEKNSQIRQPAQVAPQQEERKEEQEENVQLSAEEEMEDDEHDEEQRSSEEDYATYSKKELYELIRQATPVQRLSKEETERYYRLLSRIEPFFNDIIKEEREQAYERFIADGGEPDGFHFKMDELSQKFYQIAKDLRQRRQAILRELQEALQQNLRKKNDILERLRQVVENVETEETIREVRQLQAEWRKTGPVPKRYSRDLWARYNALLEMFDNNLSLFEELKELDRRRNLEAKEDICQKIESLVQVPVQKALEELKALQREYRHIGPVPKSEREAIQERFQRAVQAIYDRRRQEAEAYKQQLQANLHKKKQLIDQLDSFVAFSSERIIEWNQKTEEIKQVQEEWERIGPVPKEESKDVSKAFWSKFKQFFKNKADFFQKIDEQRKQILNRKQDLFAQAKQLVASSSSDNLEETARQLKQIQEEWRQAGPLPKQLREKIEAPFRELMNQFFENRRNLLANREFTWQQNQKKKEILLEQIQARSAEQLAEVEPESEIEYWIDQWTSVGYVPSEEIHRLQNAFVQAMRRLVARMPNLDEETREELELSISIRLAKHKAGGDRILKQKRTEILEKMKKIKEEITTLRNNIEFFEGSHEASKVREHYEKRIKRATEQLHLLEKKLDLIDNL